MKRFICILLIAGSFSAKAQILNFSLCMPATATANADSVTLTPTMYATDGYKSITVIQLSGPTTAAIGAPVNAYANTMLEQSTVSIKKMVPGVYVFQATGLTATGLTGAVKCTVTVPALPVIPPPRMAVSVTVTLYGVPVTIPLPTSGVSVKYADGSSQ